MTDEELEAQRLAARDGVEQERDELRAQVAHMREALSLVMGDGVHRGGISVAAWEAVRKALDAGAKHIERPADWGER